MKGRSDSEIRTSSSDDSRHWDDSTRIRASKTHPQASSDNSSILSSEDIDHVMRCLEEEYGQKLSSELKKSMREEISTAVPELTRALIPLLASASDSDSNSRKLQEEWVKTFMAIMLPHMQKIVASSQG